MLQNMIIYHHKCLYPNQQHKQIMNSFADQDAEMHDKSGDIDTNNAKDSDSENKSEKKQLELKSLASDTGVPIESDGEIKS